MGRAFGFGVTWSPFVYVCVHLCRHLQCVCAGKKRSKFQEQVFKKKVMGGLGISIHLKSIHLCVCSQEKKQPRHLYPPVTTTTTPFWGTCVCLSTKLQSTGVQCCFQTFIFGIIYPSHGYTALEEDEICKKYQAILASWSSLGTYRCM